jgi:hypothetical protein
VHDVRVLQDADRLLLIMKDGVAYKNATAQRAAAVRAA